MQNMFKSQSGQVYVLGKYRVDGLQQTVISVGTRVYLNIGNNKTKPYLLLRLLPVDYLKMHVHFQLNINQQKSVLLTLTVNMLFSLLR